MADDGEIIAERMPRVSFLQRHREAQRGAPAAEPPPPATEERATAPAAVAYEACTTEVAHRQSPARLRVHYADGTIGLMSYSYLVEVLCTSHQMLSLIYSNVAITLEGRQLDQLLDALQEEKVRSLVCYNARRHGEMVAGKPVIERVVRQSLQELARMAGKNRE